MLSHDTIMPGRKSAALAWWWLAFVVAVAGLLWPSLPEIESASTLKGVMMSEAYASSWEISWQLRASGVQDFLAPAIPLVIGLGAWGIAKAGSVRAHQWSAFAVAALVGLEVGLGRVTAMMDVLPEAIKDLAATSDFQIWGQVAPAILVVVGTRPIAPRWL